jgi:nuclear receptor co-repressor 1
VNGPSSPQNERSVKELMLGMIEMQIKKNPCGQGVNAAVNVVTSEGTPTISSILKTDHRTDLLRPSSDISRGEQALHL